MSTLNLFTCTGCGHDTAPCALHGPYPIFALAQTIHTDCFAGRSRFDAQRGHLVAEQARALIAGHDVLPRTIDILISAALLHNVGRTKPYTGHLGIDGGNILKHTPLEPLSDFVAWHGLAPKEAAFKGLAIEFLRPVGIVADLLWIADFTVGRTGHLVTPAIRIAEICEGLPTDSVTTKAMNSSLPTFLEALHRYNIPYGDTHPTPPPPTVITPWAGPFAHV